MNRLILYAAVALAVVGGAVYWQLSRPDELPSLGIAEAQGADAAEVDTSIIDEITLGNPDASVEVIEYASFTCPHCKNFHAGPFKQLKADYIDTGKIHFVYREVYFDRFGLWAAMVARCGGEARYFGIADMIYAQQAEWTDANTPAGIADNLRKIGRTAGLTNDELEACLTDGEKAQAMVALYQQNAEKDGINSTPSFVIDGKKYSNMPYDEFAAILDEKLAE